MIVIEEQPFQSVESLLPEAPPYVLLKTARVTNRERWSILGWDPWITWMPHTQRDPFGELDAIIARARAALKDASALEKFDCPVPLLMGGLSYDLGREIESIPEVAIDDLGLPQAVLYGFRQFVIADEAAKRCWRVTVSGMEQGDGAQAAPESARKAPPEISEKLTTRIEIPGCGERSELVSTFVREEYLDAVSGIRDKIAAGDCYQVNLSQRCAVSTSRTAQQIFQAAMQSNPAPMMALVDTGDWQLISTSPERFVQRRGEQLTSEPIKGTAPRADNEPEDAAIRETLLTSEKNRAELAMIVDLIRNDLGRVAQAGGVTVTDPCRCEAFTNVYHLIATVSATVPEATSWGAIFRALFPGGSITGCPKIEAMRVIEASEKVRRHFYCGSIGYIDWRGDGDWNIAIRTITKRGGQALFHLGGGIVYDSDPAEEYEETLKKGETLFKVLAS